VFEKIVSQFSDLLSGGQDARAANAGGPPRMGDAAPAAAPAGPSGGNMGGALGAAIANMNAATAASLPPRVAGTSTLDRLPEAARVKFRELEGECDAAFAIIGALNEQLADSRLDLARHEARVAHLVSPEGGRLPEDATAVASARELAERARAEVTRISEQIKRRQDGSRSLRETFANVESYVRKLRNVPVIEAAPPVTVSAPKSGDWKGAVETMRQRLQKLHEDAQAVEDAPRPSADAKAMAHREIEGLAARGRLSVMSLLEGGDGIGWPTKMLPPLLVRGADGGFAGVSQHDRSEVDIFALFVWINRDVILAAIEREIDENADDRSALTPEQRVKKRAQLNAALLACEREEVHLIEMAREAGVPIAYRPDCDPRAVLGVADIMPAPDRSLL